MGCASTAQFCQGEKMCQQLEKSLKLQGVSLYNAYKIIVTEILPSQKGVHTDESKGKAASKGNIIDDFPEIFVNPKLSKREVQILFKNLGVSDDWESELNLKTMMDKSCKHEKEDVYDSAYLLMTLIAFNKKDTIECKIDLIYKLAYSITPKDTIEPEVIRSIITFLIRIITEFIASCHEYLYPMGKTDLMRELKESFDKFSESYVGEIFKDYPSGMNKDQLYSLLKSTKEEIFNNAYVRENLYLKLSL